MSSFFHRWIQIADEAAARLLELPVTFLLIGALIALSVALSCARLASKRARAWLTGQRVMGIATLYCFLLGVWMFDARLDALQMQIRAVERRNQTASPSPAGRRSPRNLRLIEQLEKARKLPILSGVELAAEAQAEGVVYAVLSGKGEREFVAHLALVDLSTPRLEIEVTRKLGPKFPTSEFAQRHDCVVAINGEAGQTPDREASLGSFVGTWIARGEPVMLKDNRRRPFMSFDRRNHGTYVPASDLDNRTGPDRYNAHYCRADAILDGEVIRRTAHGADEPAPRTLMGLDARGQRLYLMVVDGRARGYSRGLAMGRAADLLVALGARNAMSCDQGGSSVMVLKSRGIASRPSTGGETGRATYTHFGVSLRPRGPSPQNDGRR